jgi:alanyl-tRNA synthetase
MTPEEIREVEQIVNRRILTGDPVETNVMDIDSAKKTGAMALFGEKYADTVRVVSVGDFSKELCGGTHVHNVSEIGPFFITLETGIASGVRRLEAITGQTAIEYMLDAKQFREQVAGIVGRSQSEALDGVRQLRESNVELQKEIKKVKSGMFSGGAATIGLEQQVGALRLVTHDFEDTDRDVMAGWIDQQKDRAEPVVAVALGQVNGKKVFVASASSEAVNRLKVNIGAVSKQVLPQFGGRGGGKPTFAQGSVADGTDPRQVFDAIRVSLASITGQA